MIQYFFHLCKVETNGCCDCFRCHTIGVHGLDKFSFAFSASFFHSFCHSFSASFFLCSLCDGTHVPKVFLAFPVASQVVAVELSNLCLLKETLKDRVL